MKKWIGVAASVVMAVSLSGCATLFGSSNRTVQVNSEPKGAEVYLNGQPVGVTPATVVVASPMSSNYIMIAKKGYQTTTLPISTSFQKIGILNIFFWPGFIVDALTGDMMTIDQPVMRVSLMSASS